MDRAKLACGDRIKKPWQLPGRIESGEMEATTVLAIYGAVLSTGIALTEAAKWNLQRRTRLRVEVDEGFSFSRSGDRWSVIDIYVINDGDRDEQITSVYLDRLGPSNEWEPDNGVFPDDTVGPRQRLTYGGVEQEIAMESADVDLSGIVGAFRIRVTTGRGQEFTSATQRPLSKEAHLGN